MRPFLVAAAVVAVNTLIAASIPAHSNPTVQASCGVELWSLKTLTDSQARTVTMTAKDTTIDKLDGAAAPQAAGRARSAPIETHAWRIHGDLTGYKLEADQDIHLVIRAPSNATLIAEIPAPSCAQHSRVLPQITHARAAFLARMPLSSQCFSCIRQPVTVTGVGFFDRPHGQTGVAANAVELHPVIQISFR